MSALALLARSFLPRTAALSAAARRPAARALSAGSADPTNDPDVVVADITDSIEWCMPSPPPQHMFEEPPILVEVAGEEDF